MSTEFCLWDETIPEDLTIAGVTADAAAFKRKRKHARDTDRRGGLKAIVEQASLDVFGMPLRDLDQEAEKTMPSSDKLRAAYDAVRVVAGYDPDHATLANGKGFARSDVVIGHALASSPAQQALASPGLALHLWRLAARYRRQVPPRLLFSAGMTDQDDMFD